MREDLERMAREAGMQTDCMNHGAASCVYTEGCNGVSQSALQRFAELVRADCAKVCEEIGSQYQIAGMSVAQECAAAIRNSASRGAGDTDAGVR